MATTVEANRYPRKKVAIVGSGVAGIGALWALNRSPHDVHLFEASDRLGGHTNTVDFRKGDRTTKVDTGFIVMNKDTYPNFLNFLSHIGIEPVKTDMTFGVSRDYGKFEWARSSLNSLFSQRGNIFSPRMWRIIFDIIRFNQYALDVLRVDLEDTTKANNQHAALHPDETIGEYLDREGYSEAFRQDYLLPMTAAVWSTSPDKCSLEFPAITLIRFLWNHHLLSTVANRPDWLTISTGSKDYIDTVMHGFPSNHLHLKSKVTRVTNEPDGRVRLHIKGGRSKVFDHVILATHGDQAYSIIRDSATDEERDILCNFRTSDNVAVLHSDTSLMPQSPRAWSSWNYLTKSSPVTGRNIDQVSLTYNMNVLQHIPREQYGEVLVTLNPLHQPDPSTVQGTYIYAHALYTPATIKAQDRLDYIQNTRGISYAGAWTKYGFHEDGFSSGIRVAMEHLGGRIPFEFKESTYSRDRKPELGFLDWLLRVWIWLVQVLFISVLDKFSAQSVASRRLASHVNSKVNGSVIAAQRVSGRMNGGYGYSKKHH